MPKAPRRKTFAMYAMHMAFPVTGWQAVFWDEETREHRQEPIYALALVNERRYEVGTKKAYPMFPDIPEDECRNLVGMMYCMEEGFVIAEEFTNCCGLLPPDWTLEMYTTECLHPLRRQA